MRQIAATLVSLVVVAGAAGACGGGNGNATPTGVSHDVPTPYGTQIGGFDRLPGGTAVPRDARTLRALTCDAGRLRLETDRETVVAEMDCAQMLPPSDLEDFIGMLVEISFTEARVRIINERQASITLPVANAGVE